MYFSSIDLQKTDKREFDIAGQHRLDWILTKRHTRWIA